MTDQEMADAVVALGIGEQYGRYYEIGEDQERPQADGFVRDWRVAGKCLEQWPTTINVEHLDCTLNEMLRDPRKIIEAFVEALSE